MNDCRIVFDLDNTLCKTTDGDYENSIPHNDVVKELINYKNKGYEIIISTSRNMRTHNCSVGKINAFTLPGIINWLNVNNIPFDEIHVGKPWCGNKGFYVDDRSIRPSEFINMTKEEIDVLLLNK